MSANNQTLIREHNGKFYVFSNVNAESWGDLDENDKWIEGSENHLSIKDAVAVFDNRDDAFERAWEVDQDDDMGGTEYGVQFNRLCKDDAEVIITEE